MLITIKKLSSVLLIVLCLFIMVGCDDDKEPHVDGPSNEPTNSAEQNGPLTLIQIDEKLYNYAIEVYTKKTYERYDKINGEYKISLNQLKNDLGYDISMFIHPDTLKECDRDKTSIVIDIDNVREVEYTEYPIMIEVYCS